MTDEQESRPAVRRRDRRGRGARGPAFLPGPLAPAGVPAKQSGAARFDELSLAVLDDIELRWPAQLAQLELAVEEVPVLPADWRGEQLPLGALVPVAGPQVRARLVLFRRPIEHRAKDPWDIAALILTVACEQLAPLLGVRPEDVHPDYPL